MIKSCIETPDERRDGTETRKKLSIASVSLAVLVCSAIICSLCVLPLRGEDQSFAAGTHYQSVLSELKNEAVRPSHLIGNAGLKIAPLPPTFGRNETPTTVRFDGDTWVLELNKVHWTLILTNKRTGFSWRLTGITWITASGKESGTFPLTAVERIEASNNSCRIKIRAGSSEESTTFEVNFMSSGVIHLFVASPGLPASSKVRLDFASYGPFFGLGERFSRAKLDGTKITLRPQDLLGHPDHNWTYIPVPFLFTPRGIGLYLDIGGISTWDLTSAESGVFSVEIEQASLDCYFFVGEPRGMIGAYTSLMGRSPGLPAWAFGVWICSYRGPSKVLQDARRLRQDRIPSSAIWLFDAMGGGDIMGWPLWWTGYYREPRQLTAQLHGLGFKVLTYIHPYLRSVLDPYTLPNPSFNEAERRKFFVLDSSQKPTGPAFEQYLDANLDFTNPEVVDWWEKRLNEILLKYNFDGWMEDFGEWVNDTDQFASGKTGHEMANLYPLLYHEITYEIARKAKADVVEFVRSGYAGSQSFTRVVWGGDQFPDWTSANGLPSVIPAGITAGLSGFAVWGPDISSNGHSKELWIRWTQFGALTPIMRDHLWDRPEGAVSLWYDSETTDIFRRYARLHISLFPYLYTYAHEASEDGMPIIRHLMLQYPSDVKGYDAEGEYLLGENMLVAPVTVEGATTRSLYLPQGYWVDYWTGKTYVGGQHVIVPAPLDHIPILLRAGCIIPFIDPNTLTLAEDPVRGNDPASLSNLILRVFAGPDSATSRFTLYDGTTAAVSQDTSRTTMRVDHSPRIRHYELVLPIKRDPQEVSVGKAALERLDEAYRRHDGPGWWLDRVDSTLHVSVSKDNFELKVK